MADDDSVDSDASPHPSQERWEWKPSKTITTSAALTRPTMQQTYYELEHMPSHKYAFQERVKTTKLFDARSGRFEGRGPEV